MIEITQETVKKYIKGNARHAAYGDMVDIADHLSFHVDGYDPGEMMDNETHDHISKLFKSIMSPFDKRENPYFSRLIDHRRPRESTQIKNYRRKIWVNITKQTMFKVLSSLNKIVRAEDWKIDYSKSVKPPRVVPEEQMERYCEDNYPMFGSIENWAYTFGLKKILSDPNGILAVMPVEYDVVSNDYLRPFGFFIPSQDVLELSSELVVFRSSKTGEFQVGGNIQKTPIYVLITDHAIWEAQKINDKGDMSLDLKIAHNLGFIPVIRTGGVPMKIVDNVMVNDSYLSPMLPSLDEAAREYSDHQAEIVQHIHTVMWMVAGQDCHPCNGTGKVLREGKQVACGDCKGEGVMPLNPYENVVIKNPDADKGKLPTPPLGAIDKSTEIAKLQDERISKHCERHVAERNDRCC